MAGSFRWTLPPACEGGGFGASLDSSRPCTPQGQLRKEVSSGPGKHLGHWVPATLGAAGQIHPED